MERERAMLAHMGNRQCTVMVREADIEIVRGGSVVNVEWRGWIYLSGVVIGGRVGYGRVECAHHSCATRITGIALPRTPQVPPLQCQIPSFECQNLMGTGRLVHPNAYLHRNLLMAIL